MSDSWIGSIFFQISTQSQIWQTLFSKLHINIWLYKYITISIVQVIWDLVVPGMSCLQSCDLSNHNHFLYNTFNCLCKTSNYRHPREAQWLPSLWWLSHYAAMWSDLGNKGTATPWAHVSTGGGIRAWWEPPSQQNRSLTWQSGDLHLPLDLPEYSSEPFPSGLHFSPAFFFFVTLGKSDRW